MRIKIGTKYKVYIDVLMSALFFSLAHISFQFGVSGINFSWPQLVSPFLMGSCIGMVFDILPSLKKGDSYCVQANA
jgi:membrane protease YdiL (CAAX protease family)